MKRLFFTIIFSVLCSIGFCCDAIDPVLQNVLNDKDKEMIEINIILKSQIDIEVLRERAATIVDKKLRRNILIDELKLYSEKEQHDVLSILKAEESNDNVMNIRCHWLSNAISCKAKADVIYFLAKHPDIAIIGYDEMRLALAHTEAHGHTQDNEQSMTENISMVNADRVWDLGYTGKGVIVAIIDSGVNYNHIDLADHLWDGGAQYPHHGYNVIDNNNDPMDYFGHGTHCAGTICGDGSSGLATGIAPDATLMCIKALDNYGYGSTSGFNTGMEFAIEHQADIISMSLGIMNASVTDKTLMRNTCVNALQLGVVAAVAVGNDKNMYMVPVPNNVRTPGNCPPPWLHPDQQVNAGELSCVVAVSAIDFNEAMYENGSVGPVTWTDTEFNDYPYNPNIGLIRPDVCAPGVMIKSLIHSNNNGYCVKSGTSMATPCVAGVMALLLEKQNDLSPADICMTLETTAKKMSETKSNLTGSGLVDAFEAIANIQKGSLTFSNFVINDADFNNNGNLNAGEDIKMSLNFVNNSNETMNDIKAVLSCNNELVTITDAEAEISNITANEEISLEDEFAFSVAEDAENKLPLMFDANFYDSDNTLVAAFSFLVYVSGNDLEFASFIVRNDDNGNGVLEAGETADLGIIINNTGNEIAVKVEGSLTSSSDIVDINQSMAEFNSIGGESSAVAFFNVTIADNAGSTFDIPFEIIIADILGNEYILDGTYTNACDYTFELEDYYNDGWDGACLLVKYDSNRPTDTLTIADGGYESYTLTINSGVEITLEWVAGIWDSECSFIVMNEDGEVIYTSPEFPNSRNEVLFSWINDCSCENEYNNMCDAIENLNGEQNDNTITLSWTTEEGQDAGFYEVYCGTRFLGTTEETNFTDETVVMEDSYVYSVRLMTEECSGLFQNISIDFKPVDIVETNHVEVSIYPNPSGDSFMIRCEGMTRISVYNIHGSKIMEKVSMRNECEINGLSAGVYLVEIENMKGISINKIIKL